MDLVQFNNQYKYKSDKDKFGLFETWDISKLQEDGNYYGHHVLSNGAYIIDCDCQKIMRTYEYKDKYKVYEFKKYNIFIIFSKFILGKLIKFYKGF